MTVVVCCQIFDRRSTAPTSGLFRQRLLTDLQTAAKPASALGTLVDRQAEGCPTLTAAGIFAFLQTQPVNVVFKQEKNFKKKSTAFFFYNCLPQLFSRGNRRLKYLNQIYRCFRTNVSLLVKKS